MKSEVFTIKDTFGQHNIFKYNTDLHPFRQYFESLFKTCDLEHLHLISSEDLSTNLQDIETDLHKKFYFDIKNNPQFKELYCNFLLSIYNQFYPNEEDMIFQSFPSVRFQFINNKTVPRHYDSDDIGRHPLGEKNFLIPITAMLGTQRLFLESYPGKEDFQGIDMKYGDILSFNGNTCTHYNEVNTESTIRISMDFRIILRKDYLSYLKSGQITTTNPRDPSKTRMPTKMIIGGYYQTARQTDSLKTVMDWHFQNELLLQSRPNFDINEANACFDYMKDGINFVTEYQQTKKLENIIADFIGVKHVLMTTSGSMALAMALMGCNITSGDEVIVPNYTMIATINAVKMVGANPIIADIDRRSGTLTLELIKKYRTPSTKCVIFVSLNNRQIDILDIKNYCESTGLMLIEDAAQSLGSRINGKHFGTFGQVGCFSLSTPKIISTGQGGFVITNDSEMATRMSMIKNFGRKYEGVDIFGTFGLNMKFTDIQSVIGIEQMKKLPSRIKFMQDLYRQYYNELKETDVYMIPPINNEYLPWFIDIYTPRRDELASFLKIHNIQTRPAYPEIHKTVMYITDIEYPDSSYISQNGLFLPSHTLLTNNDVHHICKLIKIFMQ